MDELTHLDYDGRARMVDVSHKANTPREAIASGIVQLSEEAFAITVSRQAKKGDPIAIAELAGIMAAKKTSDIIPLCHPLALTSSKVSIAPLEDGVLEVTATVKTSGQTGVEMEALTAVSAACLTLYDMLKAVDKDIIISDIKLLKKTGGKSGIYERQL